jgi:hypothetical protein
VFNYLNFYITDEPYEISSYKQRTKLQFPLHVALTASALERSAVNVVQGNDVNSEIRTKLINTICGQDAEF